MKTLTMAILCGALALAGCENKPAAPGSGSGSGSAAGGHEGMSMPAADAAPTTYKDAVAQIEAAHHELAAIVKDGDLSKAHMAAEKISKAAALLPDLATKGGMAAADVKEVNLASKDLQALFDEVDAAGDAGKRDAAQAAFAKYEKPLATVKAKVAAAK